MLKCSTNSLTVFIKTPHRPALWEPAVVWCSGKGVDHISEVNPLNWVTVCGYSVLVCNQPGNEYWP